MTLKISVSWTRKAGNTIYACAIANIVGDSMPEVIVCAFDSRMHVYDLRGKEMSVMEFPPEITTLVAKPLAGPAAGTGFLTGDVNGHVCSINKDGDLDWMTGLNSPVVSMDAGDVTDDQLPEVVVGLENGRGVLLSSTGTKVDEFSLPEPATSIAIANNEDQTAGNIFVLLQSGRVLRMNYRGYWKEIFSVQGEPTCMACSLVGEELFFAIGGKDGTVQLVGIDGTQLGNHAFGEKIRCISCSQVPLASGNKAYMAVAVGDELDFIEISPEEAKPIAKNKAGADTKGSKKAPLARAPASSKLSEQVQNATKCPFCGTPIPRELATHAKKNTPVYCEQCGENLTPLLLFARGAKK